MDHKEIWSAAKLAVRAYARDPSEWNAVNVELAWERLREYNSSAIWRQMRLKWLDRDTATGFQDQEAKGRACPGQIERDVA